MSDWKAGMAFDSILQTPLDYYDVTYANGHTVRYEKERPHGEWSALEYGYKCSVCTAAFYTHSNFCPKCGADMREGDPD